MTSTDTPAPYTELPCLSGHFHYADLHTVDVDAAQQFYGSLLGWRFDEIDGAPDRYVTASVDDRGKAAITGLVEHEHDADASPYWFAYVWVDDVDDAAARVVELGGTLLAAPQDVFEYGRMAAAVDPTGAAFGLWQDATPGATTIKDEPGSPFWYELHTADVERAAEFYRGLLGWTLETLDMGEGMQYHLLVPTQRSDEQLHAGAMMGLMQAERDAGDSSYWAVYFNVDDCDAAHARALELGGSTMMEPHDIPGAGRSCWIRDPQGAVFAAMRPDPRQA